MQGSLTQQIEEFENVDVINEKNPHQMRKVIDQLIRKSKIVITTLQNTIAKLQKVQCERDYWKNNYLRFKQVCENYIDSNGVQHFMHLVDMQKQLKKLQVEKQCLLEQSKIRINRPQKRYEDTALSKNTIEDVKHERSHGPRNKMYKSISTVLYNNVTPQSQHKIEPKKIKISSVRRTDSVVKS